MQRSKDFSVSKELDWCGLALAAAVTYARNGVHPAMGGTVCGDCGFMLSQARRGYATDSSAAQVGHFLLFVLVQTEAGTGGHAFVPFLGGISLAVLLFIEGI